MKNSHTFSLKIGASVIVLCVLFQVNLAAQDTIASKSAEVEKPIVEYVNGKMQINVEELNFSPNMTVWEFLQLFPELTTRGSNDVLNNYEIVMEDYSLGNNRDEVLYQMTLGELKSIVISDNPSVAYSKNGVGGVIELKPKSLEEGLSGNAQLDVSTEKNILASTNINYKKDKLRIRSYIKGEFLNYNQTYTLKNYGSTQYNSFDYNENLIAATELAKFSVEYIATPKDEITFTLWETYGAQNVEITEKNNVLQEESPYDTTHRRGVGTLARFFYAHKFTPDHIFEIGINYSFSNKMEHTERMNTYSQPHGLSVSLRYTGALINKKSHLLKLVTGGDFNNSLLKGEKPVVFLTNNMRISPLLEFRYTWTNKLFARVGARYHYDKFKSYTSSNTIESGHDYMVSGELGYIPVLGHTLRVSAQRDRICSSAGQRTGYLTSADLSYIFQKTIHNHYLNISAGMQYDYVSMLDKSIYNVYAAKFAAIWQYKWFCLSFTTHLFDNEFYRSEFNNYRVYYNLRLTSIFTLPKDWSISANFMYNSISMSKVMTEGDYFYTSLRVCKKIGRWSMHMDITDPLHFCTTDNYYLTEDAMINNIIFQQKTYYPYRWSVNLGVMFEF